MRFFLLVLFLPVFCYSQEYPRIDTSLPFFGNKPLDLHGWENRSVPYGSTYPLYVFISYEKGTNKQFEYFRIDSFNYLRYEFFRSDKGSSNKGLKSSGRLRVVERISDSSFTKVYPSSGSRGQYLSYFKTFSKEGEWEEYDDSLFYHRYWTGQYLNNRKVGVWSNYIYTAGDEQLIAQVDYDKTQALPFYTVNLAGDMSLDSLSILLTGRWTLACEDDRDRREIMNKCQLYGGEYSVDCSDRKSEFPHPGPQNYYEFSVNGDFKRHKGTTCDKFKQNATAGHWKLVRLKQELYLEIKLSTGDMIRYKLWYLDREGKIIADRQK